ncbi:rRNA maturation RNase YbeY [Deltaproteobacteria bacterium TL4]
MIEISWEEGFSLPLTEKKIQRILREFLRHLGHEQRGLNLHLTRDEDMRKLNLQYRNLDSSTDILSWSYWEEDPESELLGELAISTDRVKVQATQNEWDEKTELIRLLAHGCAHLAGYDHERSEEEEQRMLSVEIELLKMVGLEAVYASRS